MRRCLFLLLILGLLATVITIAVAGGDKSDDKQKEKAAAPSPDKHKDKDEKPDANVEVPAIKEEEEEELGDTEAESKIDKGPCTDASKNEYKIDKDLLSKQEFKEQIVDFATAEEREHKNKTLELVKIEEVATRPGCGIFYHMNMGVMNDSKKTEYNCEYFYSDYDQHICYCDPEDKSPKDPDGKDNNKCQEPTKNKYEDVKDPTSATFFANLAILEVNAMNFYEMQLEKVIKAKKRPGCGTYYRITMSIKDHDKGGKEGTYETEVYEAGLRHVMYFRKR